MHSPRNAAGPPVRSTIRYGGALALLLATVVCPATGRPAETGPAAASYWKPAPSQVVANAVPYAALPLPLADVRLTGGPLKHAQDLDAAYLLQLEPDRMLFYLRQRAGLPPKATEGYSGWEGPGRQLTGHYAGHYLSAVSYMYAATGDARFKKRADYLVNELKEVQDKQGNGYIGALLANAAPGSPEKFVNGKQRFEDLAKGVIQSGGFDLNGLWSPWYVEHKLFAGLRDAYRLTGNRVALDVETRFAGWADGILRGLDDAQIQKMLGTEFGGMNEVAADLYADTGDKRWLELSDRFEHRAVVDPLARREDHLNGLHANTQIPKILGELARYAYTGNRADGDAAEFFWDTVVHHHSFATGGDSKDEHFGEPDRLNRGLDGRTAETCNVYNLLKMTRMLFALHPDEQYAEFHERALFNHILGSIDDQSGTTCYMVPVGRGVTREYQGMFTDFTCCMGTGMESHALHGYGIYDQSGSKLWVNLYTPSTARWGAMGVTLDVQTDFPEGEAVKVTVGCQAPATFTLALRRPAWAGDGFAVKVNGERMTGAPPPGNYVELTRAWKNGDTVELTLPKALHTEPLADNPRRMALMWGPLVLAGDLGAVDKQSGADAGSPNAPVFVTDDKDVAGWLKPVAGKPGTFHSEKVGLQQDVELVPFYRLHHRWYAVYWDVFTSQEWAQQSQGVTAERERQHRLTELTVAFVQPGEMQTERDFNEQGEDSLPDRIEGRAARRGNKWFSFDLPVDATQPAALVVTYHGNERQKRTFEILLDGQRIGEQTVETGGASQFFDVEYALPAEALQGKRRVTVRFQATGGNAIAAVCGIRVIRSTTH